MIYRLEIKNTLRVLQDILYSVKIQERRQCHPQCSYCFPEVSLVGNRWNKNETELFSGSAQVPTENLPGKIKNADGNED